MMGSVVGRRPGLPSVIRLSWMRRCRSADDERAEQHDLGADQQQHAGAERGEALVGHHGGLGHGPARRHPQGRQDEQQGDADRRDQQGREQADPHDDDGERRDDRQPGPVVGVGRHGVQGGHLGRRFGPPPKRRVGVGDVSAACLRAGAWRPTAAVRCAPTAASAKLPCGGGEVVAHSSVQASQGLSPAGSPISRLRTMLTMKMTTATPMM